MKQLTRVIDVIQEKCVSCHACIGVCPVKYCNDGSGDYVKIDANMCIGCGACMTACTHEARVPLDDTARFFDDLRCGTKMIAIAAPAVASSFPNQYLNLNGWLKSLGVEAVFDVSFGAELTVKTYLEHVKKNNPATVIAQPCPAIVTYIEMYRPELLPYLAPCDSPMLHTIRMVREYYPQYKHHKVAVLSPCVAKRREFDETGLGDYNVTFAQLAKYIESHRVQLHAYPAADYDNPPAERAVLFSTPGGLLRTAMREAPGIEESTRKIEGPSLIYKYLDELPHTVAQGKAPLLIDCLNCEMGCNGGTGTACQKKPHDEIEWLIEQRAKEARARHAASVKKAEPPPKPSRWKKQPPAAQPETDPLHKSIDDYWKPGLYQRCYVRLSDNVKIKQPSAAQVSAIFREQLLKEDKQDELDCGACGYGRCSRMAVALFNNLSKPEHCALYKEKRLRHDEIRLRELNEQRMIEAEKLSLKIQRLLDAVDAASKGDLTQKIEANGDEPIDRLAAAVRKMMEELAAIIRGVAQGSSEFQQASSGIAESSQNLAAAAQSQAMGVHQVNDAVSELNRLVDEVRASAEKAEQTAKQTSELAQEGGAAVQESADAMQLIRESSNKIGEIIQVISEIARQTNLLALNAAIEAARAGQHGLGFAVVADEVRKLAERSNQAAREITTLIKESTHRVENGAKLSERAAQALDMILEGVKNTVEQIGHIAAATVQQSSHTREVAKSISEIASLAEQANAQSEEMAASSEELSAQSGQLSAMISRFRIN